MAKISIKGVGTAHDGIGFEFKPKCKEVRSCKSFRRRGVGTMTESGNFELSTPPCKPGVKGNRLKKAAHGGLSVTQDGA